MSVNSEWAILSRVIGLDKSEFPPELARLVSHWEFNEQDRRRMHELLEKAKVGGLGTEEAAEAEAFERVGHLVALVKAQAQASLKKSSHRS